MPLNGVSIEQLFIAQHTIKPKRLLRILLFICILSQSKSKSILLQKGAVISGQKRYRLWRIWESNQPLLLFILLNPSTGNGSQDDPTIRRLIQFTKKMNMGGFYLGNLYANITPSPKMLYDQLLSIDPINQEHVIQMAQSCQKIIYAWGQKEKEPMWLKNNIKEAWCFGFTASGSPKHPLYLPGSTSLKIYRTQAI